MSSRASGIWPQTNGQARTRETIPFLAVSVPLKTTRVRSRRIPDESGSTSTGLYKIADGSVFSRKSTRVRSAVYLQTEHQKSALRSDAASNAYDTRFRFQPISR